MNYLKSYKSNFRIGILAALEKKNLQQQNFLPPTLYTYPRGPHFSLLPNIFSPRILCNIFAKNTGLPKERGEPKKNRQELRKTLRVFTENVAYVFFLSRRFTLREMGEKRVFPRRNFPSICQMINWVLLLRNCCSSAEDEDDDPETKAQREKERRQANNARERWVSRDAIVKLENLARILCTWCFPNLSESSFSGFKCLWICFSEENEPRTVLHLSHESLWVWAWMRLSDYGWRNEGSESWVWDARTRVSFVQGNFSFIKMRRKLISIHEPRVVFSHI